MSAMLPSGTVATTSSVCGETTWIWSLPAGAAQPPSMKRVSRSWLMGCVSLIGCEVSTSSTAGYGARVKKSAKPLGSWRPMAPCSKRPQPSAPSQVARPTWSITPNITRPSTAGSLRS